MNRFAGLLILILAMAGCKGAKEAAVVNSQSEATTAPIATKRVDNVGGSSYMLPQAIIYKTNGDYNNNVPVTLNDARTALVSFPGPGDVSAQLSTPIELGDGWLLDRRGGIGKNTAFLKYTYAEYAALKQVPSQQTLIDNIIPGAAVTEVKVLPIKLMQALENPDLARQYIPKQ